MLAQIYKCAWSAFGPEDPRRLRRADRPRLDDTHAVLAFDVTLTSIELPAGLTSVGEIAPQTRSHADDESSRRRTLARMRASAAEGDTLAAAPSLRIRIT